MFVERQTVQVAPEQRLKRAAAINATFHSAPERGSTLRVCDDDNLLAPNDIMLIVCILISSDGTQRRSTRQKGGPRFHA